MSDPLYRKSLLRLAADATGSGRLQTPDATGVAFNPACGDRVELDIIVQGGRVVDMAHETKACVLSQASASILGSTLKGGTRSDVEKLRTQVAAMLADNSVTPDAPFQTYAEFSGAVEYTSRHRCVLLPIDAVLAAFTNLEGKKRSTE